MIADNDGKSFPTAQLYLVRMEIRILSRGFPVWFLVPCMPILGIQSP